MKRLSVLGSTGSIGRQTMELVRRYPEELSVTALAAFNKTDILEEQVREFRPKVVCVYDHDAAQDLRARIHDCEGTVVTEGMDGLLMAAALEQADMTVVAVVGMIGIRPTIAAIEAGKTIALANKETLVTAGHIIIPLLLSHRQRALGDLPVAADAFRGEGLIFRRKPFGQAYFAYRFGRTVLRAFQGGNGEVYGGGCIEASELVHGTEDHRRLRDNGQQGT